MTHALATVQDGDRTTAATDLRLPSPVNKVALSRYLGAIEDPDALKLQNRLAGAYDAACNALLGPNDIQLESGRSFKKKSAWRKLARFFGISTSVVEHTERYLLDETTGESIFVALCTVRGTAPWGQSTDAAGACGTDEATGRRKISIADAIATAETRASNRAVSNLVAMGEVSAEETSREERQTATAEAAAADMTLDEARAMPFPWRTPEKYRGKLLGELSVRMLDAVLSAVTKEIDTQGTTARRRELQRGAQLVRAEKVAALDKEPAAAIAELNATALTELNATAIKAIAHTGISDAARAFFRAWHIRVAENEDGLRQLIAEATKAVSGPAKREAGEEFEDEAAARDMERDGGELEDGDHIADDVE